MENREKEEKTGQLALSTDVDIREFVIRYDSKTQRFVGITGDLENLTLCIGILHQGILEAKRWNDNFFKVTPIKDRG